MICSASHWRVVHVAVPLQLFSCVQNDPRHSNTPSPIWFVHRHCILVYSILVYGIYSHLLSTTGKLKRPSVLPSSTDKDIYCPGFKVAFGEIDSLPFAWLSSHFAVFSAFEGMGRKKSIEVNRRYRQCLCNWEPLLFSKSKTWKKVVTFPPQGYKKRGRGRPAVNASCSDMPHVGCVLLLGCSKLLRSR